MQLLGTPTTIGKFKNWDLPMRYLTQIGYHGTVLSIEDLDLQLKKTIEHVQRGKK